MSIKKQIPDSSQLVVNPKRTLEEINQKPEHVDQPKSKEKSELKESGQNTEEIKSEAIIEISEKQENADDAALKPDHSLNEGQE
jgi:hypothetical protein